MTVTAQPARVRQRAWSAARWLAMRIMPLATVAWLGVSTGGGFPH